MMYICIPISWDYPLSREGGRFPSALRRVTWPEREGAVVIQLGGAS